MTPTEQMPTGHVTIQIAELERLRAIDVLLRERVRTAERGPNDTSGAYELRRLLEDVERVGVKPDPQAERIRALEEALRPFADFAPAYNHQPDDYGIVGDSLRRVLVTAGDLRRAAAVLGGTS